MFRARSLAVVLILTAAFPVAAAPPAPGVYTVEPPAEIKTPLTHLKDGGRPAEAIRTLAARDDAAPYLRLELQAATDGVLRRYLTEALAPIEARTHRRNKGRYAAWAEGGRLDLCAEVLVDCPNNDDAVELADLTLPLRKRIFARLGETSPRAPRTWCGPVLRKDRTTAHAVGADLTIPSQFMAMRSAALIRAERCTVQVYGRANWFVTVRSELHEAVDLKVGTGHWENSVVLVNNSTKLPLVSESLIVCDGDIELMPGIDFSVIVANGNIRSERGGGGDRSHLYATGDIVLPLRKGARDCWFHAGGTVTFAEKPKASDRVREKQPALPLGIRFLDPKEFGLTLAAQNGGVQVMDITPDSPFARYGVEDGDVITSIDDVGATSVPVFRRQLRVGVMRESVLLRIRRGNLTLTRIVFLDGIPLPAAPMPRVSHAKP